MKVYNDRRVFNVVKGFMHTRPECAICGLPFDDYHEPSMHEVFVTRGDVQTLPFHDQLAINNECNVVLVHEGDCHIYAQHTPEGKAKCVKQIVHFTNIHAVTSFIVGMEDKVRGKLFRARELLNEYNDQLHFI